MHVCWREPKIQLLNSIVISDGFSHLVLKPLYYIMQRFFFDCFHIVEYVPRTKMLTPIVIWLIIPVSYDMILPDRKQVGKETQKERTITE